jgi:hypothetical protein
MSDEERSRLLAGWNEALRCARNFRAPAM